MYYDTLMRGESGLSRTERELIAVAVSVANECLYCTIAHGAALRVLSKKVVIADQVAQGLSDADVWDAGAVAAFFNLSNRMATLADLRPNSQFYAMGRNGEGGH